MIDYVLDCYRITLYLTLGLLFFMHSTVFNHRKGDWAMSVLMVFLGANLLLRNAHQPESANILADFGVTAVLTIITFHLVKSILRKK